MAGPIRGSSARTRAPQSAMTRSTVARASLRKGPRSEIGAARAERSVRGLPHPFDRELRLLQQLARGLEAGDALLEQLQGSVQIEIVLLQGPDDGLQAFQFFLEGRHVTLLQQDSPQRTQRAQRAQRGTPLGFSLRSLRLLCVLCG